MDDEPIFGPLNLKQFIRVAFGFGLIYFAYSFFPLNISIPIIIVGAVIAFSAFIIHTPVIIDEDYIKQKRFSFKNPEDFQKWLKRKIASLQAQIHAREYRGLIADPELEKRLRLFENALKDIK